MWAFYNLTYHQLLTVVTYQANLPHEVSVFAANDFKSTHIRTQHFGDLDTAIRLLVIFQNCNNGARQRQPGTVERMGLSLFPVPCDAWRLLQMLHLCTGIPAPVAKLSNNSDILRIGEKRTDILPFRFTGCSHNDPDSSTHARCEHQAQLNDHKQLGAIQL